MMSDSVSLLLCIQLVSTDIHMIFFYDNSVSYVLKIEIFLLFLVLQALFCL